MDDLRVTEKALNMQDVKFAARGVQVFYGETQAIKDVDVDIADKTVTAFIGPSGCGKSTFLRCLNRMNETIEGCRVEGRISLDGEDVYSKELDVVQLRALVSKFFRQMSNVRFQLVPTVSIKTFSDLE